ARLFAGRVHAIAALAVVLAWFASFGNVSANPWNPLVVVLPLMVYLLAAALAVALAWFASFGNVSANPWNPLVVVLPLMVYLLTAALFAKGESAAIYPAVVFGALVAQTHIAVVTTVIATGVVALASFLVLRRAKLPSEGKWLDLATRRRLAIAASLLLLLFAPPLIEQVTADGKGNIRRITSFFLDRQAPVKPIGLAMRHWVTATSWLPDRLLSRSLATEGYFPLVMRWDAMPDHVTKTARAMTILHVGLTSIATMIAVRRRETTSAALLVLGSLTSLLAVPALQAIVGVSYHYLVFWTTAGSSIAWTGIGSMGLSMAAPWAVRLPRPTFLVVLGALGLPAALATTSLQQTWFSKYQLAPASRPRESKALSEIYAALRERVGAEKTAIVHWEGAWDMACAVILEHDKDRLDVRVPAKDRWLYSGVRGPEGVAKPLHVWFATTPLPLPLAPCLDFVAKRGDISLYTSPDDVTSCTPP
ncbi:MAG TPA: hypothetical protein VM580_13305, partial [Labilithrix sp.]|nr:hypothetical protein [Labilithrix sp.]